MFGCWTARKSFTNLDQMFTADCFKSVGRPASQAGVLPQKTVFKSAW